MSVRHKKSIRQNFDRLLEKRLKERLADYVRLLQQVLQIPTPRMEEHAAVRFVGQLLHEMGCEVEFFEGEGRGEDLPAGPPLNLFAARRGKGGGKSLLLEAHVDTVPPGRLEKWSCPPWSGTVHGGRIFARGAHDDKSGAALICMLVDLLRQLDIRNRGDLFILITTEEEFSCGGMRAYVQREDRVFPDAALLIDGNADPSTCIMAHAGALSFQVTIPGPFGSTQRREWVHRANPIEQMASVVEALHKFESETQRQVRNVDADPRWPPAIVAVTEIQSCGWWSNVPEECSIRGYCNVIPPLSLESQCRRFEAFVRKNLKGDASSTDPQISWGPLMVPPLVTPEDSPLFHVLSQAHHRVFGRRLKGRHIGGWGDIGLLGCRQTIFYGPGGGGGDHHYDEYYELDDLPLVLKTLIHLVRDWCGLAD